MARTGRQQEFRFCTWGGKRKGAGRKRVAPRKMVDHRTRPKLASRYPIHVTVRMRPEIRRLRNFKVCKLLRRCFLKGQKSFFRVCQFSVQSNHIHMICEARDAIALSRGMQGLNIRVAKMLNKLMKRRGKVLEDRYHAQILRSPRQVRHALCYVMQNARRHGHHRHKPRNWVDPFSSAHYFSGWQTSLPPPTKDPPVRPPRTWLLQTGWRRHGPITLDEVPASGRCRA